MFEFIYFLFPDLLNIKLSFHLKSASNNLFFLALEIYINYWIEKSNVEMGSEPSPFSTRSIDRVLNLIVLDPIQIVPLKIMESEFQD